jgi:hypothetical protein
MTLAATELPMADQSKQMSGPEHDGLAQTVADAIADAHEAGMPLIEAISMAAIAVADYTRTALGDEVLVPLAGTILGGKDKPGPEVVTDA